MNEEYFEEVKQRVIENTHTREDALYLVSYIETFQEQVNDLEDYIYAELELQDEGEEA